MGAAQPTVVFDEAEEGFGVGEREPLDGRGDLDADPKAPLEVETNAGGAVAVRVREVTRDQQMPVVADATRAGELFRKGEGALGVCSRLAQDADHVGG